MSWIFDGVHVGVQSTGTVARVLQLDRTRPSGTGFGLSAALPLVVQGLVSSESSILVLENPEIHLHPAAASRLGRFLGYLGKAGIQVILETHSEHILNGLRLSVAKDGLDAEELAVFFVEQPEQRGVIRLKVQQNGKIEHWPIDFFDQAIRDLETLHEEASWNSSSTN